MKNSFGKLASRLTREGKREVDLANIVRIERRETIKITSEGDIDNYNPVSRAARWRSVIG